MNKKKIANYIGIRGQKFKEVESYVFSGQEIKLDGSKVQEIVRRIELG